MRPEAYRRPIHQIHQVEILRAELASIAAATASVGAFERHDDPTATRELLDIMRARAEAATTDGWMDGQLDVAYERRQAARARKGLVIRDGERHAGR